MPVAALLEFQIGDKDVGVDWYERASREVAGKDRFERRSDWTGGMLAHVAGYTEDGAIWAVDVWESQEDMTAGCRRSCRSWSPPSRSSVSRRSVC
jgi:hypothetical protein